MFNQAKELIDNNTFTCVIVKNDEIIYSMQGKGIKPLLNLYVSNKEELEGALLADKVIGKAAAIIIIESKITNVYGYMMSKTAEKILKQNNVKVEYNVLVESILNRDKTDMCPIEKAVINCKDIKQGINNIVDAVSALEKRFV